ncbi:HAD family hydrolase [Kitasatospora sp. LaBMicrA B282]|uniref:HAD family hydrolase n=1 Tax=Kitasatospora sp. LaBMicrA B282 TaxID=3420949 RepID=UPI003D111F8D
MSSPLTPAQVAAQARRALLLDLDGVLWDTLPVMQAGWAAVRSQHGVTVPFSSYQAHLGRPFHDIMALLDLADADALLETYENACVFASDRARIFAGITEALLALANRGWTLGVVTSKGLHRALPLLARTGVPFATVRTPGSERGKPAPDPLLMALLDLRLDPAQAVYVGDMPVDQESARRAGVAFVHAAWGYGRLGEPAVATAASPAELLPLLAAEEQLPVPRAVAP